MLWRLRGRGRTLIDATITKHGDAIGAARTAADARALNKAGKLIAFKSMENSYPLGEDVALLAEFHQKGVRMAGPVHSKTNQFADSATGEARWKGLSPLGKQWVAEMNRLGIVIDASHSSDAAFDQMLALSKYPIILSHSSLRSTNDHPRNLDEARLKALAAKGGAMCISTIFMSDMNMTPARGELFGQYERIGTLSPAQQAELNRKWRELDKTEPLWAADFEQYMAMVLRAIEVGGVGSYLLRCRLGRRRRAGRDRGYFGAAQGYRAVEGRGLFRRRHRKDVERQRAAHLGSADRSLAHAWQSITPASLRRCDDDQAENGLASSRLNCASISLQKHIDGGGHALPGGFVARRRAKAPLDVAKTLAHRCKLFGRQTGIRNVQRAGLCDPGKERGQRRFHPPRASIEECQADLWIAFGLCGDPAFELDHLWSS